MSAKASGRVWDLDLPHNKRLVLLAMADHADHEGRNIYPSTDLIAWKTGYSSRQVQRIIDTLIADGILVVVAPARQQKPVTYALDFDAGIVKAPFRDEGTRSQRRQNVTPQRRQNVTSQKSRGDISTHPGVTFQAPRGDIAMSPEPWNHHEPPTPTANERSNGVGDDDYFHQLRKRGIGQKKAREIAARCADRDRVLQILDTRPPAARDPQSPAFGKLVLDILDGVADLPAPRARAVAAPLQATRPNIPDKVVSPAEVARRMRESR
jgi:helix-turn-helix protein